MSDKNRQSLLARPWVRTSLCLVLAMAAIIGGWLVFRNNYAKYFWVKNWGVIEDGRAYRSAMPEKRLSRKTLENSKVDRIINLQSRKPDYPRHMAQEAAVIEFGVEELRFPMRGNGTPSETTEGGPRGRAEVYASAITALVEGLDQGDVVWVQCGAGTHRTGGVVACYRMLVTGWPPEKAYEELQSYGWKPGKHRALTDWVNSHMQLIAEGLVARGVIQAVPSPLPHLGPVRPDEPPLITGQPPAEN